ncbi:MAG: porin, partial [Roseibium sp.]
MKLKSLMLGAAAVATATTAQAADLPVAPEPVDYVRVCDAYGARFYYIPGTETCLRVGGRVRTQFVVNNVLD